MISEKTQERDRPLGIDYRCLDIRTALPEINRQFDVVTMCEILEHLEQPEALWWTLPWRCSRAAEDSF